MHRQPHGRNGEAEHVIGNHVVGRIAGVSVRDLIGEHGDGADDAFRQVGNRIERESYSLGEALSVKA